MNFYRPKIAALILAVGQEDAFLQGIDYSLERDKPLKPEYGMENWWIEEREDGRNILRGNITGRNRFQNDEPVLNFESTYTSAIIGVEDDKVETINSFYRLGEPMNKEVLRKNQQWEFSFRAQFGLVIE